MASWPAVEIAKRKGYPELADSIDKQIQEGIDANHDGVADYVREQLPELSTHSDEDVHNFFRPKQVVHDNLVNRLADTATAVEDLAKNPDPPTAEEREAYETGRAVPKYKLQEQAGDNAHRVNQAQKAMRKEKDASDIDAEKTYLNSFKGMNGRNQEEDPALRAIKHTPSAIDVMHGPRTETSAAGIKINTWDDMLEAQRKIPGSQIIGEGTSVQLKTADGDTIAQPESSFFEIDPWYKNPDGTPAFDNPQAALHVFTGTGDPLQQTAANAGRAVGRWATGAPGDTDFKPGYGLRAAGRDAAGWAADNGVSVDPNAVNKPLVQLPKDLGGDLLNKVVPTGRDALSGLAGMGAIANKGGEALKRAAGWALDPRTDVSHKAKERIAQKSLPLSDDEVGIRSGAANWVKGWADDSAENANKMWDAADQIRKPDVLPDTPETRRDMMTEVGDTLGSSGQVMSPTMGIRALQGAGGAISMAKPAVADMMWKSFEKMSPRARENLGWLSANPAQKMVRPEQLANLEVASQAQRNLGPEGSLPVIARAKQLHGIEPLDDLAKRAGLEERAAAPEQLTAVNQLLEKPPTVEKQLEFPTEQPGLDLRTPNVEPVPFSGKGAGRGAARQGNARYEEKQVANLENDRARGFDPYEPPKPDNPQQLDLGGGKWITPSRKTDEFVGEIKELVSPDGEPARRIAFPTYGGKQYGTLPQDVVGALKKERKVVISVGENPGKFRESSARLDGQRVLHIPDAGDAARELNGMVIDERAAHQMAYFLSERTRYSQHMAMAKRLDDLLATTGTTRIWTRGAAGFGPRQRVEEFGRVWANVPGAFDKEVTTAVGDVAHARPGKTFGYDNQILHDRFMEGGTLGHAIGQEMDAAGTGAGKVGPTVPGLRTMAEKKGGAWATASKGADMLQNAVSAPAEGLDAMVNSNLNRHYFPTLDPHYPTEDAIKWQSFLGEIHNGATIDEAIARTSRNLINFSELSGLERAGKTAVPFLKYQSSMYSGALGAAIRHPERFRHLYTLARAAEQTDTSLNDGKPINQKFKSGWEAASGYPIIGGGGDNVVTIRPETPLGGLGQQGAMIQASLQPGETRDRGVSSLGNPFVQGMTAMVSGTDPWGRPLSGMTRENQERVVREHGGSLLTGVMAPYWAAKDQTGEQYAGRPLTLERGQLTREPADPRSMPEMAMGNDPWTNAGIAIANANPFTAPFAGSSIGRDLTRTFANRNANPASQDPEAMSMEARRRLFTSLFGLRLGIQDIGATGTSDRRRLMRNPPRPMLESFIDAAQNLRYPGIGQ